MPAARTVIDVGSVAVYHACGAQVLVTHTASRVDGMRIDGVCPLCRRYVYLVWAANDPVTGMHRDAAFTRAAGPEVAPRARLKKPSADEMIDQLIEDLESRLTVAYLRSDMRRRGR